MKIQNPTKQSLRKLQNSRIREVVYLMYDILKDWKEKDLKEYESVFRKPLSIDYKGYRIISVPPPSSGGILIGQILGMIEKYPLTEWGFHSVRSIHLIAEAERRAFADRAKFAGDPDFINVPVDGLLKKEYLTGRFADFDENKASMSSEVIAGSPCFRQSPKFLQSLRLYMRLAVKGWLSGLQHHLQARGQPM